MNAGHLGLCHNQYSKKDDSKVLSIREMCLTIEKNPLDTAFFILSAESIYEIHVCRDIG